MFRRGCFQMHYFYKPIRTELLNNNFVLFSILDNDFGPGIVLMAGSQNKIIKCGVPFNVPLDSKSNRGYGAPNYKQ